jgi:endonuclease/exonuclease/phosphatase family metal-dependent hydrolase
VRGVVAAVVAAPWVAWAVVRALGLDLRHPLVAAMAFTPYAAATAPLPVLVALALRRWVVAAVAALAALLLAAAVLPRALDGPRDAPASARGPELTVMTSNLLHGRADPRAVVRLVREHRVDVLALQELTPEAVEGLDAAGARSLLPARVLDVREAAAGSGLMARRPLRRAGPLDRTGPSQPEAALAAGLRVKTVHPEPPITAGALRDWRRVLRALPGPREGRALRILAGDFNATLDQREMRRLLERGYLDAADAVGAGLRTTWPVRGARRPEITIDHVLVPPGVRVRRVAVEDVRGSDHRAVIAVLVLPR